MDKQRDLLQKSITIVVIILLLSIGFTSLISAKEETQEYTLMTPSIIGLKKQQISLTSEQCKKLDSIFEDLRNQLDSVSLVEETKLLYKRTIDNLVDNGLLSRSDAFIAKKLLFSNFVDSFYSTLNIISKNESGINNSFCWITGEATESYFLRPLVWRREKSILSSLLSLRWSPIVFYADITFGRRTDIDHWTYRTYSKGWVWTKNILDIQSVIGEFRGVLSKVDMIHFTGLDINRIFPGVYFFLGIGFNLLGHSYFLGRAALVKINEKPDE